MRKLARILLGLAGFGLLALVFMPESEHRAAASNPQSVIVTNTPVPVQGTVSVGNTPSVTIANTPSVNVANTAVPIRGNVQVFNPLDASDNPVPLVVRTAGLPYFDSCIGSGNPNSFCSMNNVPSGMRLVIQSASFTSRSGTGVNLYRAAITTTVNGNSPENLYLALSNTGTDQYGATYQAATVSTTLR
ncbi:MAG TPA: hypothetical protein VGL74_11175 [Terriglobales bacterium]